MNKLDKFAALAAMSNVVEWPAAPPGSAPPCPHRGHWAERFGNHNPLTLELGCGRGEYTLALARRRPDANVVGVDIKGARLYAGAKSALDEHLANAAFLRTRVELLPTLFAPAEVAELWITFPDPQPRKASKRLVGSAMLNAYAQFLEPGATVHLKTDSAFLHDYLRALLDANGIQPLFDTGDLYDHPLDGDTLPADIQTYYETRWRQAGLPIKYTRFALPGRPLSEPPQEPPRDNYHIVGQGRVEVRK